MSVAEKKKRKRLHRATLKELHTFANKVRAAGGGNPIDALMPAVPQDPSRCLIAKNLNFNCEVSGEPDLQSFEGPPYGIEWWMILEDEEVSKKIAKALGRRTYKALGPRQQDGTHATRWAIPLPRKIGAVASDFDEVQDIASNLQSRMENWGESKRTAWNTLSRAQKKLFRDMWPYVDASTREAYSLATLVTDDGKIVV